MSSINERPEPGDLLRLAFELINERGTEYNRVNDLNQNFRETAAVASVVTGKPLTAWDVAMVMTCVKLLRAKNSPDKLDNYVDGMNYMAFAACFQGLVPMPPLGGAPAKEVTRLKEVKEAPSPVRDAAS
jgi:hypothetical protein